MSKLEDLYEGKKRLERAGYKLTKEMLQDIDQLEEQLIKTEVLPTLSKDIEPRLSKIQRDLVLVVEYHPGKPISVALSRKKNIAQLIDAKLLEPDPIAAHIETGPQKKTRTVMSPNTGLCVTLPNGHVIMELVAADTFANAIKEAGLMNVRNLNIYFCRINIVSTTRDHKYGSSQREMSPGLFVLTHSSTKMKKKILDKISARLNLGWKVEIIERTG